MKQKMWIAATAVGATLAGVGIGAAIIPGSDGVIHGCYANKMGALRVIDSSASCNDKTETAIEWNKQGIQGIQGEPGPQGSQGDPGATGTSHAYVSARDPLVLETDSAYSVINSLPLPQGKYLVTSKFVVDVTSDVAVSRVDCYLDEQQYGSAAGGFDSSTVSVSGDRQAVLVMNTGINLTQDSTVVVKCVATRARATLYRPVITALRVDDLQGAITRPTS